MPHKLSIICSRHHSNCLISLHRTSFSAELSEFSQGTVDSVFSAFHLMSSNLHLRALATLLHVYGLKYPLLFLNPADMVPGEMPFDAKNINSLVYPISRMRLLIFSLSSLIVVLRLISPLLISQSGSSSSPCGRRSIQDLTSAMRPASSCLLRDPCTGDTRPGSQIHCPSESPRSGCSSRRS